MFKGGRSRTGRRTRVRGGLSFYLSASDSRRMSLVAFLEKNWMMALVFVVSGAMLVMPLVTRRLSKAKDVGNLEATVLINKKDAILVETFPRPII